jgi:hypothetical protein
MRGPKLSEILLSCALGAILGAGLMTIYILRTGGF